MDSETTAEVRAAIKAIARDVKVDAIQIATTKGIEETRQMISHIDHKVSRDGFTAVIGPGAGHAKIRKQVKAKKKKDGTDTKATIRHKDARWALYKGVWHEYGTSAGLDPRPFMEEAWDANSGPARRVMRGAVKRAIEKAARG